jgi:hypothetical protein
VELSKIPIQYACPRASGMRATFIFAYVPPAAARARFDECRLSERHELCDKYGCSIVTTGSMATERIAEIAAINHFTNNLRVSNRPLRLDAMELCGARTLAYVLASVRDKSGYSKVATDRMATERVAKNRRDTNAVLTFLSVQPTA